MLERKPTTKAELLKYLQTAPLERFELIQPEGNMDAAGVLKRAAITANNRPFVILVLVGR